MLTVARSSSLAILLFWIFLASTASSGEESEPSTNGVIFEMASSAPAFPVLLYRVDFEPPLHIAGGPPAIGQGPAPRYTPTRLRYGEPLVVDSSSGANGQSLEFTPTLQLYDQVSFALASNLGGGGFDVQYPTYFAQLVVTVAGAGASSSRFAISLDGPMAQQIVFTPDGAITAVASWDPDSATEGYRTAIGHFQIDVPMQIAIALNTGLGRWEIWLDRNLAFSGRYPQSCPAHFAGQCVRNLRLNAEGTARVRVDDVYVMDRPLDVGVQLRRTEDSDTVVPHSLMLIEVILMGSEIVDIAQIDTSRLKLGPANAAAWKIVKQQDVNQDGFEDLIVRFRANDTGISLDAEQACLQGEVAEVPFYSCNVVKIPQTGRSR